MNLVPHSEYQSLETRFSNLLQEAVPLRKRVFRMVNPNFSSDADLVNGKGGLRAAGRWNLRRKFHCTYTSTTPETALEEVLAATRRKNLPDEKALPRTLVCLELRLQHVLDLTNGDIRRRAKISAKRMVEEPWWSMNLNIGEALTQAVGRAAFNAGFEAIMVPSSADFQRGVNIVIFPENLRTGSSFSVVTPL